MKILFRTKIFLLLSFSALIACEKMTDIHKDFIEDGEIIYATSSDSLYIMPGRSRIKIKNFVFNGENIKKSVVEWEEDDKLLHKSMDVSLNRLLDSVTISIDNLKEKAYIFKVYNVDINGNRSLKKQISTSVYGDNYESTLINRPLSMIKGGGYVDSLVITWGPANEDCVGTEINYTNNLGKHEKKLLTPEEDRLVIRGWKSESEMNYRSLYLPEPNSIDTFSSALDTILLPDVIL